MSEERAFDMLLAVNVNGHTEKKKTGGTELTYLSWPFAWAEVKKRFPDASYRIIKQENGLPYAYDERTGYMVYTEMTIQGVTHEMWLPVMDGANKAMKAEPYQYQTKFGPKTVEAATMFDINKTIMRCLVKNIGMHGLGLYLYAGEDVPQGLSEEADTEPAPAAPQPVKESYISLRQVSQITMMCEKASVPVKVILDKFGADSLEHLTTANYSYIASNWSKEFLPKGEIKNE